MDSLTQQTILRYHPADGSYHYSAIVLEDNILEVKQAGKAVKNSYSSVGEWLESLPGAPVWSDIIVSPEEDKEKKEKEKVKVKAVKEKAVKEKAVKAVKEKAVKAVKEKAVKLRLIPMKDEILSTRWTIHLHRMMKEANPALLKREDVILAFNALVEVLVEYQAHVHSIVSGSIQVYRSGVDIDNNPEKEPLHAMCEVLMNSVNRDPVTGRMSIRHRFYRSQQGPTKEEQHITARIISAYRPLFALIRDDVLPYMERMNHAIVEKEKNKRIQKIMDRMDNLHAKHEAALEERRQATERMIVLHERIIATWRMTVASIASEKD